MKTLTEVLLIAAYSRYHTYHHYSVAGLPGGGIGLTMGIAPKIIGEKFMIDHILWWKYKQVFTLGHIEPLRGDMCLIYYMWMSNFRGRPIGHNFYCIAKASSIMR